MTSKLTRLQKRSDFLQAHKYGRKQVTSGFLIQMRKRRAHDAEPDHADPRVGFTASKKVGKAVQRNRAKRRLRALCHEILQPRAKAQTDYVLIARPETLDVDFDVMEQDLNRALDKLEQPRPKRPPKK